MGRRKGSLVRNTSEGAEHPHAGPVFQDAAPVGTLDSRIALVASWTVLAVVLFQSVASMITVRVPDVSVPERSMGVVGSVGTCVLFVFVQESLRRRRSPQTMVIVLLLVFVGLALGAGAWMNAGVAAAALMVSLNRLATASIVVVGLPLYVAVWISDGMPWVYIVLGILVNIAVATLLYALMRLVVAVEELHRTREVMARLKVDDERHRISRDLHDILGRSLVAVSLRTQTAMRLLGVDTEKCRDQLEEISRLVMEGQSSLRSLTRGETFLGLEQELATATQVLGELGIPCRVEAALPVHGPVDGLGARIVRESVTNMLKHSRPSAVEIELRKESSAHVLVVVNDGARRSSGSGGTGLRDLAGHVERAGGTLQATRLDDGRFRLLARIPYSSDPTAPEVSS